MKPYRTKDGHIKESAIKEAQAVIEAVMAKTGAYCILMYAPSEHETQGIIELGGFRPNDDFNVGHNLDELYINRLHEMAGTTPPPF